MKYQHEMAPWLAIAVLIVGIGSTRLLLGVTQLPNRTVIGAPAAASTPGATRITLGEFAEVSGALPTMAPVALVTFAPTFTPVPTPTPLPPLVLPNVAVPDGGEVYLLTPAEGSAVGWAKANDEVANHFGDFNIYAGSFGGQQHVGAIQFDLSGVPPGAPIRYADLTLTGLADEWLGAEGAWSVQLLADWMNKGWAERTFYWLARPDSGATLLEPILAPSAMGIGRQNSFVLPPAALTELAAQLYRQTVAFRVLGPVTEADNLFGWDSGFGARTLGRGPVLRIVTGGPAPLTPPPSPTPAYVVITSTPMDDQAMLMAAVAAQTATAQATPLPPEVTPPPTATRTPLPPNWVTPIVMVNTPTPENGATAAWQAQVATAAAVVNGTATPTPPNVWTATPTALPTATPLLVYQDQLTPTATPSITPEALPALLRGKILFYSDRNGDDQLMVMNPDGSNVAVWTGGAPKWIYATAKRNEDLAPDAHARVIVSSEQVRNSQLWIVDAQSGTRQQLTHFNAIAYDPVWSPTGNQIAFISPEPGNDELFTINADGSDLRQLTFNEWEWDKHPTWSPDGSQIVFWSNRATRRKQIWIMNADGSNVRNLSNNEYNDWDPVWVK